ncbi:MAG: hypothetical protein KDI30_07640 [Pseudomonadales bacterium]|nr:hypothetical protein [Pseudomonadales bacterium]
MSEVSEKHLQMLLIAYLAIAKDILNEQELLCLQDEVVQQYILLANEVIAIESLMDRKLVRKALQLLVRGLPVEEIIFQIFSLHIYRLCLLGSQHPLERGIIRQQIIGYLPLFESAVEKKLFGEDVYRSRAESLMAIADKTAAMDQAMAKLALEYDAL